MVAAFCREKLQHLHWKEAQKTNSFSFSVSLCSYQAIFYCYHRQRYYTWSIHASILREKMSGEWTLIGSEYTSGTMPTCRWNFSGCAVYFCAPSFLSIEPEKSIHFIWYYAWWICDCKTRKKPRERHTKTELSSFVVATVSESLDRYRIFCGICMAWLMTKRK